MQFVTLIITAHSTVVIYTVTHSNGAHIYAHTQMFPPKKEKLSLPSTRHCTGLSLACPSNRAAELVQSYRSFGQGISLFSRVVAVPFHARNRSAPCLTALRPCRANRLAAKWRKYVHFNTHRHRHILGGSQSIDAGSEMA